MGRTVALSDAPIRIGRGPGNQIPVDDPLVSRRHAEVRPAPNGQYEVLDLRSRHGTFVNGRRVTRKELEEHDLIVIGRHSFRLVDGTLEEAVDTGEVAYAAVELSVRMGQSVLLDRVSFSLEPCSLLGVIGPSGSGKSTLMNALAGYRMASEGDVLYGGQSLYRTYDALRRRIGLVPQRDILHESISVRRALEYAAEIRFPGDVTAAERTRRVEEVMDELGLTERSHLRIRQLSGGQRKRVSVGLELLSQPALLFLDEPTSGLDPHHEQSLMEVLREIADHGRTVVVTTHSVQSLRLCDRIIVLAPGGKLAYFGPPQLVTAYFERPDYSHVFEDLTKRSELDWSARFREHPYYQEYVEPEDIGRALAQSAAAVPPAPRSRELWKQSAWGSWKQFRTLTKRYLAVLAGDRRNLALLVVQAPLLGLLMLAALPSGELAPAPPGEFRVISQAGLVLLVLVLGVTWLGMSNAVREIAKELPIYRRERAAGLSITAYVASKAVVLGAITALQSMVLVALALSRQDGPRFAVLFGWPVGELMVAAILTGLAAMGLGLLISALAKTDDQATSILPIVVFVQLILALGGVFPEIGDKPGIRQMGYASTAQWGFAASASTADFNNLQSVTGVLTDVPAVRLDDPGPMFERLTTVRNEPRWDHTPEAWLLAAAVLTLLAAGALLAAELALRRYDAGRRAA